MLSFLISLHLLIAVILVGLVLIQRGRGAEIGAAFGSGASQTVFGARGSGTFLSRMTAVLAAVFFLSSMGLAYVYSTRSERASVTRLQAPAAPATEESGRAPEQRDVPQVPGAPAPGDRPPP